MENIIQELKIIEIDCKIIKEYIFGNIYGIQFGIINENDNNFKKIFFINNNIVPISINIFSNNYELKNLITNKIFTWKSNNIIKKHLSPCECILCQEKIKIKNEFFYNIAESIIT